MSDEPREPMPPPALPPVTRRSFLFKLGLGLNALAAALVAVPLIGYVISAVVQTRADQAWIPLGSIGDFPERQTRLATYRNPFRVAWDGTTADIPCWVRRVGGALDFRRNMGNDYPRNPGNRFFVVERCREVRYSPVCDFMKSCGLQVFISPRSKSEANRV